MSLTKSSGISRHGAVAPLVGSALERWRLQCPVQKSTHALRERPVFKLRAGQETTMRNGLGRAFKPMDISIRRDLVEVDGICIAVCAIVFLEIRPSYCDELGGRGSRLKEKPPRGQTLVVVNTKGK